MPCTKTSGPEITSEDLALVDAARNIIRRLYKPRLHFVGAALRTRSGKVFTAVHLGATVGRVAVCAEPIVLGKAISEGETAFDTIVAVRHPSPDEPGQDIRVVSPCGMCRELISDYGLDIKVILQDSEGMTKRSIADLLPWKFETG